MKKFLLSIFAVMLAVFSVQAEEYSYTLAKGDGTKFGNVTWNKVEWNISADNTSYCQWDGSSSKGHQFGSSKQPCKTLTLSTSGIKGTITKIVVNTSGASSINASLTVSVGGIQYGNSTKLTSTSTDYTFENTTSSASGEIKLSYANSSSKAIYIKSIAITYTTSGSGEGGGEPVVETVATPIITPETTTFNEGESVFVSIATETQDAEIYYTLDGTDPSTENGELYEGEIEITETTTVKAIAVKEGWNNSEVVYATYTKVELTEGCYVKVTSAPADWSGKYLIVYEDGADAYVFSGVDAVNGYVAAEITDGVIVANSEIDAVAVEIATMENGYSIECVNGYIYGTVGQNKLNFNATTAQLNTIELAEDGVEITSGGVFCFNADSNQKRFRYYGKTAQKPVQLYKYTEPYTLSVTNAGYATLFLDFNAAIPTNVEAYIIKKDGINNGYITLTQVTGVLPANTGVIVKANANDYTFNYAPVATAKVEGNLLEGSVVAETVSGAAYVLGYDINDTEKKNVVFAKAKLTDGTSWRNNANKAYLPVSALSAGSDAPYYSFRFEGEGTTGVENVEVENEVKAIFDLTGRRVEEITAPGIYIVNGKKTLVK